MNIQYFLKIFLLTIPVFFLIDLIWLGVIAKDFYRKHLGYLLRDNVLWMPAIAFYLFFLVGLVFFVVMPALDKNSLIKAALSGAFFGFITYMTYDLTNYALVKDWPAVVVFVDILWGVILSTSVASISYLLAKWIA